MLILLSAFYGVKPAWASDRLADFSVLVRDLDAEAEKPSQSTPAQNTTNQGTVRQNPSLQKSQNTADPGISDQSRTDRSAAGQSKAAQSASSQSQAAQAAVNNKVTTNSQPAAYNGTTANSKQAADNKTEANNRTASNYRTSAAGRTVKAVTAKNLISISELLLTAGAESCMDGRAKAEDPVNSRSDIIESSVASKTASPVRTVTGGGGDRLMDFASLVRETEEEAGITDSDPESDPVLSYSEEGDNDRQAVESRTGDSRLEEFARLAGEQGGDSGPVGGSAKSSGERGGDSRLEEFARLAGEQGGEGVDSRLVEFASISGGASEIADDRIVALAKVSEEHEKEMERKYGPRIEDNIIRNPSDYGDGDRVVATSNTKPESAALYTTYSGYGSKSDSGEKMNSIGKILESVYSELSGRDKGSDSGDERSDEGFSVSGIISDIRNRVRSYVYSEDDKVNLGTFTLTAYDACIKCCGKTDGITSTNTHAKAGRTIAVDPSVIPYGSKVMINGNVYIAEDTGSAIKGNKIDIYMDTHEQAVKFGRQTAQVYLIK